MGMDGRRGRDTETGTEADRLGQQQHGHVTETSTDVGEEHGAQRPWGSEKTGHGTAAKLWMRGEDDLRRGGAVRAWEVRRGTSVTAPGLRS